MVNQISDLYYRIHHKLLMMVGLMMGNYHELRSYDGNYNKLLQ